MMNLIKAYDNFFKLNKGYPKFKSKKDTKQSCRFTNNIFKYKRKINGNRIQEFSGRTIARFDTSYIHDFSGAIQYKLDGFFSRRELMAILAIIYGN